MSDIPDDDIPDESNVVSFSLPDMKAEAQLNNERQGLAPRALTKYSDTTEARLWVNSAGQLLGMMVLSMEIDDWCADNARYLELLETYHPDEYETLCADILAAQLNARSIRF